MSNTHIEAIRSASFALLLISIAFSVSMLIGCATVPVTPATKQINTILTDGTLDKDSHDTAQEVTDKDRIRAALTSARAEIIKYREAASDADRKAAANATWAGRGRILAGVGVFIVLVAIIGVVMRVMRLFGVVT